MRLRVPATPTVWRIGQTGYREVGPRTAPRNLCFRPTNHSEDAVVTTSPNLANDSERRSAQNRAYAALALEHLDAEDPRLAWLFPPGKPPRQKVLEELGRIAMLDQDSCYPMAVELCALQPCSTHAGAAWLRHQRLGYHQRGGDPKLLRRSILRAINGFQYEYPGTAYTRSSTRSEVMPTSGKPNGAGNRRPLERGRARPGSGLAERPCSHSGDQGRAEALTHPASRCSLCDHLRRAAPEPLLGRPRTVACSESGRWLCSDAPASERAVASIGRSTRRPADVGVPHRRDGHPVRRETQ